MTKRKLLFYMLPLLGLLLMAACNPGPEPDPVGDIAGIVTDADSNEPLAGVGITLSPSGKMLNTGSDGRYAFYDVDPGNYSIQAQRSGYNPDSKSVSVFAEKVSQVDFKLKKKQSTGSIVGIVKDAYSREPLGGVELTLASMGLAVTTGSDGRYEFKEVAVGDHTVQAKRVNYVTDTKTVSVSADKTSPLDFLLITSNSQMEVSQSELDFGTKDSKLTLDIFNKGNADMDWHIDENISWLTCSPTSGKIQAGKQAALVVTVDRSGMNSDESQSFTITSNGGSCVVRVNVSVPDISIKISPENLDFGGVDTSLDLILTNTSEKTVSYTLSPSEKWINMSKTSGSLSPNNPERITVSVNRKNADGSAMPQGDYNGLIKVLVNDRTSEVPVRMSVLARTKPTVEFIGVTEITQSEAVFNAGIVSVGSSKVFRHGFCWSTEENPTLEKNEGTCNFGECTTAKDFDYKATSLKSSTVYFVCAYAENEEGIVYSSPRRFTTHGVASVPTVETGVVSNIQANQVDVRGMIENMGNVETITQYGHVWSTQPLPTTDNYKTEKGQTWSTGPYTSTLTNLQPRVTYHVRAYATNEKGTAYGEDITFTTDYGILKLLTTEATNVTSKTATVNGRITDKGGYAIVERGVCWGTEPTPTVAGNSAVSTNSNDEYPVALTGLTAETRYYARAYVKTETEAIFYGNEIMFTTLSKEVDVTIDGFGDDQFWNK